MSTAKGSLAAMALVVTRRSAGGEKRCSTSSHTFACQSGPASVSSLRKWRLGCWSSAVSSSTRASPPSGPFSIGSTDSART